MISFCIMGKPVPKQRPRFRRGHVYTCARTQKFEEDAGWQMKLAMRGRELFTTPISVTVEFVYAPSKTWRKRHHALREQFPVSMPDIDNTLKSLFDAGNEIVWFDDKLICEVTARKVFGPVACINVTVNDMVIAAVEAA